MKIESNYRRHELYIIQCQFDLVLEKQKGFKLLLECKIYTNTNKKIKKFICDYTIPLGTQRMRGEKFDGDGRQVDKCIYMYILNRDANC